MNRQESYFATMTLVVISSVLVGASVSVTQFNDVLGQNATTTTNQTGTAMTNQSAAPTQNQTTSKFGNLTSAWFETVESDISAARDALHSENMLDAYATLGHADATLFAIAKDPTSGAQMIILKPLDDHLTAAQAALRNNDSAKALVEINTADTELLKLNQQLPQE